MAISDVLAKGGGGGGGVNLIFLCCFFVENTVFNGFLLCLWFVCLCVRVFDVAAGVVFYAADDC